MSAAAAAAPHLGSAGASPHVNDAQWHLVLMLLMNDALVVTLP
jgi:hypothetical protein